MYGRESRPAGGSRWVPTMPCSSFAACCRLVRPSDSAPIDCFDPLVVLCRPSNLPGLRSLPAPAKNFRKLVLEEVTVFQSAQVMPCFVLYIR